MSYRKDEIEKLAKEIRERFPDAISVNIFVNVDDIEVEIRQRSTDGGSAMRTLNGQWDSTGKLTKIGGVNEI